MTVTDNGQQVFIEGIPRLEWGKDMGNTFIKSLQLTLKALGEDVSYDHVMGISGAAFRIQFHRNWCPSSADATVGFELTKPVFESLGNTYEFHHINRRDPEQVALLHEIVRPPIDRGIPVIAIDLKKVPDWGLITGYTKDKHELICRTYFDEGDQYSVAEKVPWVICIVKERARDPDERQSFVNSLRLAVQLAKTTRVEQYMNGFKAYEYWIHRLGQHRKFTSRKKYLDLLQPNAWIYISLIDARKAAANYLDEMKHRMNGDIAVQLIDGYRNIVSLLKANRGDVPFPWELQEGEWTREMRERQIEALDMARATEKQLTGLIEEILNEIQ